MLKAARTQGLAETGKGTETPHGCCPLPSLSPCSSHRWGIPCILASHGGLPPAGAGPTPF